MPSYRAKLLIDRVAPKRSVSVLNGRVVMRSVGFLTASSLGLLGLVLPAWAQLPGLPPMQDVSEDDAGTASPVLEPPPQDPLDRLEDGTEPSVEILPGVPPETLYPEVPGAILPEIAPTFDEYRLGPGDSIFVSVQRFPDLAFQATLDFSGNVIVPIEGAVSLEGQTLEEATNTLRLIYNRYVVIREVQPGFQPGSVPPDVTLALTAQRGVEVTILGEVERPGFYPLPQPRVSTALLLAGGATTTADLRNLVVQRRIGDQLVEEAVDLFTPLKRGSALPDLRLENGDVLIVNRLDPSDLENYDRNLVARSTLAQPEITVRVLNYSGDTGQGGRGGATLGGLNVRNGSTFIDAVTQLGLNPDRANLGEVGLIRFDPETGQAVTMTLDARAAFFGDPTQNPQLEDNDVIVVGRTLLTRLTYVLNTVTAPFQDVLSFLLFFDGIFDTDIFD
ncbi:MAG: polysaccharide biosynthesis/export family protein [Cyanobacteria bacterium J06632_22]